MRVTILDYGAGNLHSLAKALACVGAVVAVESDGARASRTDVLVLPGVGAFRAAAARLAPARQALRAAIQSGLPTLGICLGMQLLFDESEEGDAGLAANAGSCRAAGLGVIAGRVTRLRARQVPHIGWNSVTCASDPVFGAAPIEMAYFAHSYACRPVCPETVIAWSEHEGDRFPAVVRAGGVVGVQFHPEKSSSVGLELLRGVIDAVVTA